MKPVLVNTSTIVASPPKIAAELVDARPPPPIREIVGLAAVENQDVVAGAATHLVPVDEVAGLIGNQDIVAGAAEHRVVVGTEKLPL